MNNLEKKIEQLSPELQQKVEDYIESLLQSNNVKKQKKLRMSWAGALQEFRDQYTSLELQKKALEWWGD